MKSFLNRSALVLSALALPLALPLAAQAQDQAASAGTAQTDTIVVSAEFQRDWDRGSKLEAEGLADLGKSERNLIRHSADVVTSQNTRDTNEAQASNARRNFEAQLTQTNFMTGKEARDWANGLEKVAKDWEKYSDTMEGASKNLERALSRQSKAQNEVQEAQAKVDRGRTMMRSAERESQAARLRN